MNQSFAGNRQVLSNAPQSRASSMALVQPYSCYNLETDHYRINAYPQYDDVSTAHHQYISIRGNGIAELLEYPYCAEGMHVIVDGLKLVFGDPYKTPMCLYSDRPSTLYVVEGGKCTRRTYSTVNGQVQSTSTPLSDEECSFVKNEMKDVTENVQLYWKEWNENFNKKMNALSQPQIPQPRIPQPNVVWNPVPQPPIQPVAPARPSAQPGSYNPGAGRGGESYEGYGYGNVDPRGGGRYGSYNEGRHGSGNVAPYPGGQGAGETRDHTPSSGGWLGLNKWCSGFSGFNIF